MEIQSPRPTLEAMRELLAAEPRGHSPSKPWLMANMVTALDGSYTVSGHSAGLSGVADQAHFHALREIADIIVAGGNTVRTENYRTPNLPVEVQEQRAGRGQHRNPRLVVLTHATSSTVDDADSCVLGDDPEVQLRELSQRWGPMILCEGGPHVLRMFADHALVDEWFITVSPLVAGSADRGIVTRPVRALSVALLRVAAVDDYLLLRYGRTPTANAQAISA